MLFKGESYNLKHLILDISIISLLGFIFILSGVTLSKFDTHSNQVDDVLLNWNEHLIFDINEKRTECQENYSEFLLGKWGGTVNGCNCLKVTEEINLKYKGAVLPDECPNNLKGKCEEIEAIEQQNITTWQLNSLCIQQKNQTYYDYIRQSVPFNEECPYGTMQCGIIDSLNNKLCLKGRVCPINDIVLSGYKIPLNYYYEDIRMRRDYYLFYTRLAFNGKIPVQFKLSQGNLCIDPDEKNVMRDSYVLDKDLRKDYCSVTEDFLTFDFRYRKIDSMANKEIYQQNGFLDKVSALPNYHSGLLEDMTSLYVRSFIGWDVNCLANATTTPENLIGVNDTMKKLDKFNIALFVMIGVSSVYLGICGFVLKRKYASNILTVNIITGVSLILYLVVFCLAVHLFNIIDEIDINLFSCGDNIASSFLMPLKEKMKYTRVFYLIIIILSFLFFGAHLIMLAVTVILYLISTMKPKQSLIDRNVPIENRKNNEMITKSDLILIKKEEEVEDEKKEKLDQDEILSLNKLEEEKRRKRLEDEEERKKKMEEERRKQREEEEKKNEEMRKQIEEDRIARLEEEERRKKLEEEDKLKQKIDEENRKKIKEEQELKRKQKEEEDRKRLEEQKKEEEEEKRRKQEEEENKKKAEEQAKKQKKKEVDKWGYSSDEEKDEKTYNIVEYK